MNGHAIGDRYRTLDGWRALAALWVVVFHCTNTTLRPEMGWWARVALFGWAGVFIFFPISGYCILAAVSRSENATLAAFLRRRWRRIVPPYWVSIAVAVLIAFAAAPFNGGRVQYLKLSVPNWLNVATLTQTFVGLPQAVNPVYWSLCYEEQFYLVIAISLFLSSTARLWFLGGITAVATLYDCGAVPPALRVEGLFIGQWSPFAAGLAGFGCLHVRQPRWWGPAMFGAVIVSAVGSMDPSRWVSLVAAMLIVVAAPADAAFARTRVGRWLIAWGAGSYSLYLIHVPLGGRVVNLLRRSNVHWLVPSLAGIAASIGAAALFYRFVERRFLNQRHARRTIPAIEPSAA